jgi:diphosphomevalonate decarboxylase
MSLQIFCGTLGSQKYIGMTQLTAAAQACANIAFIKYWGNRDARLRLPANGSISMNLDGLQARTRVTYDSALVADVLTLNGQVQFGTPLQRVSALLERVRSLAGMRLFGHVESENNFPTGVGIASSAAAFAALSFASSAAAGLQLSQKELSRLARTGSGSACRSIPAGYVEWRAGEDDEDSYAFSIAPPDHWNIIDCIAVISTEHKPIGSSEGHALADTSPLQPLRVADAPRRLNLCRRAILERDFEALTEVVEMDCHMMHAVMMTSSPPLLYWEPATLAVMHSLLAWRKEGLPSCYTIDAGANVHVLCLEPHAEQVSDLLKNIPEVKHVLVARAGDATQISAYSP